MRLPGILFVAAFLAIPGCGATRPEEAALAARIGQRCSVQFRRGDALGAAGGLPVSPMTNEINGAHVSLIGKLAGVGGDWVVVSAGDTDYCIPREAILLISFPRPTPAR